MIMKKKVKPVLRWPGSKYRKIDKIIKILGVGQYDHFLDLFAGSGIVGVNVKNLIGCEVTINDYDKIFPITDNFALNNMLSYGGLGKNKTKSAEEYFLRNTSGILGKWTL